MNTILKVVVVIFVIAYFVSPDLAIGPIDDIIVVLLGAYCIKSLSKSKYDEYEY